MARTEKPACRKSSINFPFKFSSAVVHFQNIPHRKPVEKKLNGYSFPFVNRLAEHHVWVAFNQWVCHFKILKFQSCRSQQTLNFLQLKFDFWRKCFSFKSLRQVI